MDEFQERNLQALDQLDVFQAVNRRDMEAIAAAKAASDLWRLDHPIPSLFNEIDWNSLPPAPDGLDEL